jgi:uncharacterized protein (DUF1778 family)
MGKKRSHEQSAGVLVRMSPERRDELTEAAAALGLSVNQLISEVLTSVVLSRNLDTLTLDDIRADTALLALAQQFHDDDKQT